MITRQEQPLAFIDPVVSVMAIRSSPATNYCATFLAAATESTITASPVTLPFTVAL